MNGRRKIPAPAAAPPRRRTGNIALILLGAAAVGGGGGWAIDQLSQPDCDPRLDPQCAQSSSSSRSWYRRYYRIGSGDTGVQTSKSAVGSRTATQRGGFGSVGRWFSRGS